MGQLRTRGREVRVVLGVVAVALLAGACTMVDPRLASPVTSPGTAGPCAIAAVRSCALPYPSDEFTVADPFSGTGRRIEVPEAVLPQRLLDRLGPGASPEETFRDADGFSVLTPVIFEMDRAVDPATLPSDGGDVFAVFDAETGQRVPIRAEVPAEAVRHGAPDTVVVAWPRRRYEFGRTYVARVTTALRPRAGGVLPRAAGLDAGDSGAVAELRAALAAVEGDRWDQVVSATRFTVRSEADATSELDRMAAIARSEDHPLRNVVVGPPFLVEHAAAVVRGEVRVSDFRDADGIARAAHGSTPRWVPFVLALPERPAGDDGAPIAIYGHGLTVAKETMVPTASANAQLGVATIGIDVPNHGDRQSGSDAGYLLDLTTSQRYGRLASMPLQGVIDHVSLLEAVTRHVGNLELQLPADLLGRPGEPAPRIDTSRILYQGTSMGGVLGAAFTALAPELDGSFLQVAGTGIADIIYHSILWPLFMRVVPDGASTGDAYALMGAATMTLDLSDGVNVLHRLRADDTPVFLAYGVGDGIVPNFASGRMVDLLDLPLVGPRLRTLQSNPAETGSDVPPADGWGFAQIWSSAPIEIQSFGAHIVFAEPRSKRVMQDWMRGRLAASGLVAR